LTDLATANPLLEDWAGPYRTPPFDRIRAAHFLPALDEALALHRAELEAVATNAAPADFENTLVALERAGAALARVRRVFWTLSSAQADADLRAIEPEMSARLTRHATAIGHDRRLFERVATVWRGRTTLGEEQARLTENSYRGFVSGGALLDPDAKARFAAIDERLGELSVRFGHNVLAAGTDWSLQLDEVGCAGLPHSVRAAAARRALLAGKDGWLFTLDRGQVEDLLGFATNRDVRETVWRAFTGRCDGGAHDNWPILTEIVALRQERAHLLGHASYAEEKLEDSMARTPAAAMGLLDRVWTPALKRAADEQAELQTLADAPIEAWDWRFYAEQIRRDRHALNGAAVKEHLTLDAVRAAAFDCAGRLYGLHFDERPDVSGWHADVRAWAVTGTGGEPVGLLYTDYLARPEKHGGAWMGALRVQERLDGPVLPIVYTVANFAKAPPPEQTRLSIDEARTLFHEFGHALHALLSDVTYPSLSGTSVARDFVEFPSKFMEHWIVSAEVLAGFGVPAPLIAAIGRADAFGQGFATVELAGSSIVDLAIHMTTGAAPDVRAIEAATLARIGMPATIGMRHRLPHFTHVFDGGYAAAYYSYLWSEVLDADAFAAFTEAGDMFARDLADRFRREILERGDTRDAMADFVAFRGREPDERHLLLERGLLE
jgi:peptidyl-dipeptidase Dcp